MKHLSLLLLTVIALSGTYGIIAGPCCTKKECVRHQGCHESCNEDCENHDCCPEVDGDEDTADEE